MSGERKKSWSVLMGHITEPPPVKPRETSAPSKLGDAVRRLSGGRSTSRMSARRVSFQLGSARRSSRGSSGRAASVAASVGGSQDGLKTKKAVVWPEFTDSDINSEKWDVVHKGKDKDKSKSPVVQHFYDDPDGKLLLPPSLRVSHWKRPQDFIVDKVPVIVDNEGMHNFDLLTNNEAAHESELIRWMTSQIDALWKLSKVPATNPDPADPYLLQDGTAYTWRPWEHVYAITKVGKGPNMPQFNPCGKYCVRLFWMGCWRKITVDDTIPFDDNDNMLLPCTTIHHELWPMLLAKALIKVASLDYNGGSPSCEFGDFNVIQCLTGWLPEVIPLQYGPKSEVWELLKTSVEEFKLPDPEAEKLEDGRKSSEDLKEGERCDTQAGKEREKSDKSKEGKKDDKAKGKDAKDKGKDKDKDKTKEKSMVDDSSMPNTPQVVVFASYHSIPKYPVKVSQLAEMADASERLRQMGLSNLHTHPLLVSRTRSCPLDPPPPPEIVPAWKLIRPRKKKVMPTDEPKEAEIEKPIQCVEVTSPFVNYKVSPVPIPTDIHRPRSGLGSRMSQDHVITEGDENAPDPPPQEVTSSKSHPYVPQTYEKPVSGKRRTSSISDAVKAAAGRKESKGPKAELKSEPSQKDLKTPATGADKSPRGSVITENGEAGTPRSGQEDTIVKEETSDDTKPTKVWFDFDMFCKCFKSLIIYHKQATYPCNFNHTDLKGNLIEERTPLYLFVDNLKPSEIVVSYTALSNWNETPPGIKDPHEKLKSRAEVERSPSQAGSVSAIEDDAASNKDGPPGKEPPIQPGVLTAEPHSWKTLVTGQPILRIRTTGTKAAMLTLPPGRHVLKLSLNSPLGHHVHLCSATTFVFGDEEAVMTHLVKESCRFVDNAVQVMTLIGKCCQTFADDLLLPQAWDELVLSHCPYINDARHSKSHHFKVFNDALFATLRKVLEGQCTPEMAYAWRVFTMDFSTKNPLGIGYGQSRPATAAASHRGSAKPGKKQKDGTKSSSSIQQEQEKEGADAAADAWANREATAEEHVAAVKLQRNWRGYWTRKAMGARHPGNESNVDVQEQLMKAWTVLEQNIEQNGLFLFRTMFKTDPELMALYPFHQDEWNKISYSDYQGTYPEQSPNAWFVVFREIFHVTEPMLVVPKLHISLPTCLLRVVDNDTGEEVPKVFQKVAPQVYKKNKLGYTFVAEARAPDAGLPAGKWRLRLIGALSPLPAPAKNEVNSNFHAREIRDYYVPNKKSTILRYSVRVLEEHLASIQLQTSKPDVYIRLAVLDNNEEVIAATGKGHVVLPSYIFQKDPQDEERRSNSRASGKTQSQSPAAKKKARGDSGKSEGRQSQCSQTSESVDQESSEEPPKPHNYMLQATVLRDSWPLSEASWAFVQTLIEQEKMDLKLNNPARERPPSAPKQEKTAPTPTKGKAKGKEKAGKEKDKKSELSRPPSQQFDTTKPHWILRFVSDAAAAEEVDVKKDTSRADEIRAMKKAWEDAEPGRAAKAQQSRLQYLNTHTINLAEDEDQEAPPAPPTDAPAPEAEPAPPAQTPPIFLPDVQESESVLTLEPPPPPPAKTILREMDPTPFIRTLYGEVRYKDEEEAARQEAEHEEEIHLFRRFRDQVEQWRENDKKSRNDTKIKQLEMFEDLQAQLDQKRKDVLEPREAFRQKFLEAERLRLEEIAAQEAAMKAEMEKSAPSPKGRKSAKGKKSPTAGKKKK